MSRSLCLRRFQPLKEFGFECEDPELPVDDIGAIARLMSSDLSLEYFSLKGADFSEDDCDEEASEMEHEETGSHSQDSGSGSFDSSLEASMTLFEGLTKAMVKSLDIESCDQLADWPQTWLAARSKIFPWTPKPLSNVGHFRPLHLRLQEVCQT